MANLTDVERITHHLIKQTTIAISWTGGSAVVVALCAFVFQVWAHFNKKKEEKDKEEKKEERGRGADTLNEARRRANDDQDEIRRRRANDEDDARREHGRRAEARNNEAA